MPVRRLFVSVPIPSGIREALGPACAALRASVPARALAWVDPETWHLTLRFLGDVETGQIPGLVGRLRLELSGVPPFVAECCGLDWLPSPQRPRVLFAGVRAEPDRLQMLHDRVNQATAPVGVTGRARAFVAHATLARVRDPLARGVHWARLIAPYSECRFGLWTLDACHLMASELRPEGARHTELSRFPLLHPTLPG